MTHIASTRKRAWPLAACIALTLTCPLHASGQELVELPRLEGSLTLDGRSDEPAWQAIEPLPLVMHWPTFRGAMTERTEIRVAYNDEYIWAAGRFYDSRPEEIRANSLYRDRWNGDDAFDLILDSFNDNETALKFTTTPLGIMLDEEVSNDADPSGGATPLNSEWNGFWDVATTITDEGWFAEMRIPYSSLGFEPQEGKVVMGLIAARYISRKNEKHIFPAIPPDWALAEFKPSQAQDVRISGVAKGAPLYVTPYLLSGFERTRDFEEPLAPPGTDITRQVGLDLKYGLTHNLTLDLTLNTDFAQAEADELQVNLDRFNLFFPEKRKFFQERASIFQFNTGDEGRLFHSRRIGLDDEGQAVPIAGGARLTGRVGSWDLGVMSMQVRGAGSRPGENDAVVRVRSTVANERSTVGGLATSRVRTDGRTDLTYGVDGQFNLFGDEYMTLQWAQSYNHGVEAASVFDRTLMRLFWQRRSLDGLGYQLEAARAGPAYEPTLGFQERVNYTALKSNITYAWQPGGSASVSRHKAWLTSRLFLRSDDGSVESALQRFRWSTTFKGGNYFNVALNLVYEDLDEELVFDDAASVPAGSYFGPNIFINYDLNPGARFSGRAVLFTGTFMDGWRGRVTLNPTWVVSPHLSLDFEYVFNRLWFPARNQRFDADLTRLRVQTAVDIHLSIAALVQYSMAAERLGANVRLRYHFREGQDLYLVYDTSRDLGRLSDDLSVLGKTDQRLILKYEHTFQPGS
ncbi:MAG: carbohydrate binding family 9 domain-containing protein [Gemmatimonadetes bacterium]|uniref:Carbohydrate binding family 9 domain-containing protein n=1 Tax=Candidatus Kutchimonas denitrificans TaxID=3056748 RepID=A0AAE4Z6C7_9BACT|nr:carbohydrate binding family 9 domain-containing protein [Gemmatimonadota bacterium]NIR74408.1 carbohydrate binding family 9 domain-containing protein [Candidatus Kutchimonas denitrificans]NIS02659.1 carbohydrate binding family 9 domain-containing protein [Gemmatimonadota bacterium]NIT68534.1 carbohydrate binding family 9 domain-containing protein [Gemmatimonadota bacterium]NIU52011.1 hypothetical protein [Gemmatimonadota bacterium]